MKKLFFCILFFSFIAGIYCHAQQIIWSENFEYYQQNNFSYPWSVNGNAGSYPWGCGQDYIIGSVCFPITGNTTRMAGISDLGNDVHSATPCDVDHNDSDVLLVSPSINLTGYTTVAFRYDSYFTRTKKGGHTERATVEASTDGGNTWTILKAAPVSTGQHTTTSFIDLSAYANTASLRLGFRYSDSGQHMKGWMIDNLQVYSPLPKDIALVTSSPSDSLLGYKLVNDSVQLSGKVQNLGSLPVTSFKVHFATGSQVYTDSVTGINLLPFDTVAFVYHRSAVIAAFGRQVVRMWVSLPGDPNAANDSGKIILHGASFLPQKEVTIEEGTGTWFGFAPQGHVYMDRLRVSDYPAALISMHDQDALVSDVPYLKYLEQFRTGSFVPFFLFDRRASIEPNVIATTQGTGSNAGGVYYILDSADFFGQYDIMKYYFGFADITLAPIYTSAGVSIQATVKPSVDLVGDYRLAVILTEDKCKGTSTSYDQQNLYAGGAAGIMGGYESLPNPVPASAMIYNSVGRAAYPAADGAPGSLPSTMLHNQSYTSTLNATFNASWKRSNMNAIVILLRMSDSTILNAAQIPIWPLAVNDPHNANSIAAAIYPNPASTSANLLFTAGETGTASVTITDITGRAVYNQSVGCTARVEKNIPIRLDGWASGMYLITVRTGTQSAVLKLVTTQ